MKFLANAVRQHGAEQVLEPASGSSEQMIVELYTELRRLASAKINKLPPGQTLQATALVHDAYLRLSGEASTRWENRAR